MITEIVIGVIVTLAVLIFIWRKSRNEPNW